MKICCDVHISLKIVKYLRSEGFVAIHVNHILDKWHTKDTAICKFADDHDFIILTKDADFKNSYLINNTPNKLIKVDLGNISNVELLGIISKHLQEIQELNQKGGFLMELGSGFITFTSKGK